GSGLQMSAIASRDHNHIRAHETASGLLVTSVEYQDDQTQFHVLECGCGPGWLWQTSANLSRIPTHCTITLTDLSPGMVAEAQSVLASHSVDFRFQDANIEELPFEDNRFDVVTANHMLYHVPSIPKAIAEVRRVLKPDGRFVAVTNGAGHLRELKDMAAHLVPNDSWVRMGPLPFSLENGQSLIGEQFDHLELHRVEGDALHVIEIEPIIAYILSSSENRAMATETRLQELVARLEAQLATDDYIYIGKDVGLFVAW
ncbi:MAG: class I SAM-dependent methyltransferase, partial [Chloroflexota bacterium]